ncbi:MAG: hypothetical protein RLZZ308_147 [Candidatus Parcubacteria bacterium]|jgi:hypothetical protein
MNKQIIAYGLMMMLANVCTASALTINELFSNPVGDDSGREWVEIYNETDSAVDIASLTISIKGGSPSIVTPVSGGTSIPAHSYAIIGSTVSGATKVLQDYPEYTGVLVKSALNLVNTGVTSIDIRLGGVMVDSIASYTAAKEGKSYARIGSQFVVTTPTLGKENTVDETLPSGDTQATTTPIVGTQSTIPQLSPPSADITLYLPFEKTVVAGAPTTFSVYALTGSGKSIDTITYTWSFGDGGHSVGSSTVYRYMYPGMYVVYVDGSTGQVAGKARMKVKVVEPDIAISSLHQSKHGSYIDITNPNPYELDISGWKLSFDGALFSFPFTTTLLPGVTHISGQALGFASATASTTKVIKLLFPDMSEVIRVDAVQDKISTTTSTITVGNFIKKEIKSIYYAPTAVSTKKQKENIIKVATTTQLKTIKTTQKDTRLAEWLRKLF